MTEEQWRQIRNRHVRRFGDPTYVHHDDIGALLDEVQTCWAKIKRMSADNKYIKDHVGNVVGYVLATRDGE